MLRSARPIAVGVVLASGTMLDARAATLNYLWQARSFTSWVGSGPVSFETDSSDFNQFKGWSRLDLPNGTGLPDSTGFASQDSVLRPDGITFTGTVWGIDGNPGPTGSGGGTSSLNVVFSIAETALVSLVGTFKTPGESSVSAWNISLTGDDIGLIYASSQTTPLNVVQKHLALTPGVYRLAIEVVDGWVGLGGGAGRCSFSVEFNVIKPVAFRATNSRSGSLRFGPAGSLGIDPVIAGLASLPIVPRRRDAEGAAVRG